MLEAQMSDLGLSKDEDCCLSYLRTEHHYTMQLTFDNEK